MTELLSLTTAAARLGISSRALRAAIQRGALPAQKIGKTWVVRRADVDDYQVTGRLQKETR